LAAGLCPDPLGSLQHSPRPHRWIKGERRVVEGRGGRGKEERGKNRRKGRERKEAEGGREGKGRRYPLLSGFLVTSMINMYAQPNDIQNMMQKRDVN